MRLKQLPLLCHTDAPATRGLTLYISWWKMKSKDWKIMEKNKVPVTIKLTNNEFYKLGLALVKLNTTIDDFVELAVVQMAYDTLKNEQ